MKPLLLALALLAAGAAQAQGDCIRDRYGNPACPPPGGSCLADRYGEPQCSPPDGSIVADRTGELLCGRGGCVTDVNGEVWCSIAPKGAATIDRYGKAVCVEGCERATKSACARPR